MIVAKRFKGDENTDFQWIQHDQYGEAMAIIFDGCRKHYLKRFKDDHENEIVPALKNTNSFDHRVLQDFHDHLAAYWRKRNLRSDFLTEENAIAWLSWLEKEMREFRKISQIYVGVCFLALDKYDNEHEKKAIESLQSYAQRTYPLKWHHYLKITWIEYNRLSIRSFGLFLSELWESEKATWRRHDTGTLTNIVACIFLASCFSLLIIAISNRYELSDFFTVSGIVALWFIGIVLLLTTCMFLWVEGEKLIEASQGKKKLLGYCMKGTVIAIGMALFFLYLPHAYYDPDCPWAGAARYC